jgi:hypothetical protein
MENKLKQRIEKYFSNHPLYEEYKGWKIRLYKWETKWFGTQYSYTVDVRVGVESCMASTIEQAREFIDEKIKEGKTQQEDKL